MDNINKQILEAKRADGNVWAGKKRKKEFFTQASMFHTTRSMVGVTTKTSALLANLSKGLIVSMMIQAWCHPGSGIKWVANLTGAIYRDRVWLCHIVTHTVTSLRDAKDKEEKSLCWYKWWNSTELHLGGTTATWRHSSAQWAKTEYLPSFDGIYISNMVVL